MSITFVGAASASNGVSPISLTMPVTQADDVAVMFLTRGAVIDQPIPSGWTQIGSTQPKSNGLTVLGLNRVLTASDSGATLAIAITQVSGAGAGVVACSVYRGVDTSAPIDAFATAVDPTGATATSHTTPAVTVVTDQAWVVDSAAVRPATANIIVPAGRTQRTATPLQAGNIAVIADSNGGIAPGAYAGAAYSTDPTLEQGVLWSVALKPAAVIPPPAGDAAYQMQSGLLVPVHQYQMESGVLA